MTDVEIRQLFLPLWNDIKDTDQVSGYKHLLAHYTSLPVAESILSNNELWFSNPLLMNDISEVRNGILLGTSYVMDNNRVLDEALGTDERIAYFKDCFRHFSLTFANDSLKESFIFCFSEHNHYDIDGKLSMWRGYGNDGKGIALVIDPKRLPVTPESPFIFSKVKYMPDAQRIEWLEQKISDFASILRGTNIPKDKLNLAAYDLFDRICVAAYYSKHQGFAEECEWRITYLRSRDFRDKLVHMSSYHLTPNGIEPKFKFKVNHMTGVYEGPPVEELIDRIIIGPSISTPLAKDAFNKLLETIRKPGLIEKVHASSIPYRGS